MLCGPGGTGPSRCRCAATLRQAEPETPRREGFSKAGAQRGSRCLQASRGTAFYLLSPLPLSPSPAVPCPLCPSASAMAEEVEVAACGRGGGGGGGGGGVGCTVWLLG